MNRSYVSGIYKDISIDEYHESAGISNTGISLILDCPKKYWHYYHEGIKYNQQSKSFKDGALIHTLILEPHLLHEKYTIIPDGININRNSNEGKKNHAIASSKGRPIIKWDEYKEAEKVALSARLNPTFSKIFLDGCFEHSFFSEYENGVILKCRPDFYNDYMIIDIKTTECAKPDVFCKSIANYGYHRQAAIYLDTVSKLTGVQYKYFSILAVEKNPPYLNAMYLLDQCAIETGREEYQKGLEIYKKCLEKNEWPGYEDQIQEICLPGWYK